MTIKEFYEIIGADWQDVLQRFGGNEAIVEKFAIKFLEDPGFSDLKEAIEQKDLERAFRAAHTLKGVCLNLGLSNLYRPTYDITEVLRSGTFDGTEELLDAMEVQYRKIVELATKLKDGDA